ncbi:putative ferric reductase [Bacillus mesophilus]|uniref:DUF4181 domain-containing protein n=1 Tax=Bacillus mesophilus TaxID=1808955 RepID=A0A6M0QDY3_9BACI|nr:DUF4181 domain-containing protein [Bacillus mesophilus]MBM7662554.1 putative ferric reductase [Bacillus mesophilus]NEY73378.1 DUF4181 domain-containing protein [Bacillus mesophilus]
MSIEIMGLLLILLIYLVISQWFLKRKLHIKEVRKSILSGYRKKRYVYTEFLLFILLFVSTFYMIEDLGAFSFLPLFMFFLLTNVLRGIEEWIENRSEKGYYHDWLSSVAFLIIIIFLLIV